MLGRAAAVAVVVMAVLAGCDPNPPPPVANPVVTSSDVAVAYQQNEAHDGIGRGSSLLPPLSLRWKVDLRQPHTAPTVSHAIIVGGRVFVTASIYQTTGLVFAFDVATGRQLWGPVWIYGRGLRPSLGYGSGTLVASNYDGEFRGLDPATGRILWTRDLPGDTRTSPVVSHGIVLAQTYVAHYGLDAKTGATRWETQPGGDQSSPLVVGDRFFARFTDGTFAWDFDGQPVWSKLSDVDGGMGRVAVAHRGRIYARDPDYRNPDQIMSPDTGRVLGTFDSVYAPAFHDGTMIVTQGPIHCHAAVGPCTVRAIDPATGRQLWSYIGDGETTIAPLVVNDVVYLGSHTGVVTALDARTGAVLWSDDVGSDIWRTDEHNGGAPLTGLAAGHGYLAVPAHEYLLLYGPAGPALSSDADTVQFAPTPKGHSGPSASIALRNTGASTMETGPIRIEGSGAAAFRAASTCAYAELEPLERCTTALSYRPTSGSVHTATAVVDAPGSARDVRITLRGSVRQ
jgi:outer membrane protein assembly factor BamB